MASTFKDSGACSAATKTALRRTKTSTFPPSSRSWTRLSKPLEDFENEPDRGKAAAPQAQRIAMGRYCRDRRRGRHRPRTTSLYKYQPVQDVQNGTQVRTRMMELSVADAGKNPAELGRRSASGDGARWSIVDSGIKRWRHRLDPTGRRSPSSLRTAHSLNARPRRQLDALTLSSGHCRPSSA